MKQFTLESSRRDMAVTAIQERKAKLIQKAIKEIEAQAAKQIKELDYAK